MLRIIIYLLIILIWVYSGLQNINILKFSQIRHILYNKNRKSKTISEGIKKNWLLTPVLSLD